MKYSDKEIAEAFNRIYSEQQENRKRKWGWLFLHWPLMRVMEMVEGRF